MKNLKSINVKTYMERTNFLKDTGKVWLRRIDNLNSPFMKVKFLTDKFKNFPQRNFQVQMAFNDRLYQTSNKKSYQFYKLFQNTERHNASQLILQGLNYFDTKT